MAVKPTLSRADKGLAATRERYIWSIAACLLYHLSSERLKATDEHHVKLFVRLTAGAAEDQRRNGFTASPPGDTDSPVRQRLFFGHSLTEKFRRFRQQIAIAVFGHFLGWSSAAPAVTA